MAMILTESAREILLDADAEAQKLGDTLLRTEHLLLAIAKHEALLDGMNDAVYWTTYYLWIHPGKVLEKIGKKYLPAVDNPDKEPLPLSPNLKLVLEYAEEEARSMGYAEEIAGEHLLLGIIRNKACKAVAILGSMGVRLADIRETVIYYLEAMDRIPEKVLERNKVVPNNSLACLRPEAER